MTLGGKLEDLMLIIKETIIIKCQTLLRISTVVICFHTEEGLPETSVLIDKFDTLRKLSVTA